MWIILGFFLSFSSWALQPSESISNVKLLRALPKNIVMINRGLEDGIMKNDHAKLSNENFGFSSRAICLKVSADVSYWRLYRIPNSEAISLDYTYTLVGIGDKEIPYPASKWMDQEFELPKKKEAKKNLPPDPFLIKRDLPERLTKKDLISDRAENLSVFRGIDKEVMRSELSSHRVSLFASPFMKQSINEGESLRFGLSSQNDGRRYRLFTQFEQQQTKLTDPVTKESVSTRSTLGSAQFIVKNITSSVSSLSLVNYNSQRFSEFATPKSHWQVGLLGFTWHLHESKSWEYIDLSYIPLYDSRNTEMMKNGNLTEEQSTGLRHGFRFGFKKGINERVALENILWVRPYQSLETFEIDGDDLNLANDLKLIINLSKNFYFDYNFVYQKDKLWKTLSNLPEDNVINSLNLRYDYNL